MSRNPIPYIASKAALAPTLIPMIAPHYAYCEVFGGAAHVLCRKDRSPVEAYNDLDGRLGNLFRVLRDHHDDPATRLSWTMYARDLHAAWRRTGPTGDPIADALRTFYLLRCSMLGDMSNAWAFSRQRDHAGAYERSKALLEEVAGRFRGVYIDQRDFREFVPGWDGSETLFFCDPPYYGEAGAQFWPFSEQDHRELADLLHQVKAKVVITYYDHPEVRRLYQGWNVVEHIRPRRGSNLFGRRPSTVCELIITNYTPPQAS
jgi:DNA adenine methylase